MAKATSTAATGPTAPSMAVESAIRLKGADADGNETGLEFRGTEDGMQIRARTAEWSEDDYIEFTIPWDDWRVVTRKIPNPLTRRK